MVNFAIEGVNASQTLLYKATSISGNSFLDVKKSVTVTSIAPASIPVIFRGGRSAFKKAYEFGVKCKNG